VQGLPGEKADPGDAVDVWVLPGHVQGVSDIDQSAPSANDSDTFDDLLSLCAPPTAVPDDLEALLLPMVAEARLAARRAARPRVLRRAATVGAVVLLGLGGAGAAAASGGWHVWWSDSPDGAFTYALPSGAVCEDLLGNIQGLDPDANQAVRDWFDRTDVVGQAEVEAEIQRMRTDTDSTAVLQDGTAVDSSYGTDYYQSPDREYALAMHRAVGQLMTAELERLGYAASLDSFEGESSCPGAKW
jgi:hypothetical protein